MAPGAFSVRAASAGISGGRGSAPGVLPSFLSLPAAALVLSLAFGGASAQSPGAPASDVPGVTDLQPLPETAPLFPDPGAGSEATRSTPAAEDRAAPASAAGERERQQVPPAAVLPGRQSDPPAAVPASPSETPEWFWRNAEIAETFECPTGPIAAMLAAAQGESEFSPALELEREVLVLCRDRWTVLKELMDAELALASVLRADDTARELEAIALEEQRRLSRARAEEARQLARTRIEAARAAEARKLAAAAKAEEERAEPAPAAVVERDPGPAPEERYGWFALAGTGTDLRAGVTDGRGRWWVRAGDSLPGGVRIGAIRSRPPGVIVEGGAAAGLPYRRWRR